MSYVEGELGRKIQHLMDRSNENYEEKQYEKAIQLLVEAWDLLPDNKNQYDESFLIVWGILSISITIKNIEIMNQWVNKIFYADPERLDTGERELWAGKVAYESERMDEARKYFQIAVKKSRGRCFGDNDCKYKKFYFESIL